MPIILPTPVPATVPSRAAGDSAVRDPRDTRDHLAAGASPRSQSAAGGGTSLDREAFQRFYDRTSAPLRRFLQRVCRDPGRAEDVFQESYVRLINRPGLDLDAESLRSYLFRTASNLLRDQWRREGRERLGLLELFGVRRGSSAPPASGARLDLDAALDGLAPRDRAMLWLAYVEGYGHRDIGRMLGVRAGSVRVLLFRLRQRLAARLAVSEGPRPGGAS